MPSWESNYNDHDLWIKLASLEEQLSEIEAPEDDNARDTLEYMLAARELASARQRGTNPLAVTSAMLTATATAVQNVIDYLAGWLDDSYSDAQMDSMTEALLQSLSVWPPASPEREVAASTAAVEQVSAATSLALQTITNQRDELAAKVDSLGSQQRELDGKVAEQTQIITTAVATLETTSKEALDASKANWTKEREIQHGAAEERLQAIRDLEQQAKDLVHSATGASVATDYGEYAKAQTKTATIWDIVAALVGAAGVGALLVHLFTASAGSDGEVGLSLTRLAASLGTLGIAALIAKRGSQHHHEARDAKRTDLAIRRVGPFTSQLEKDEQKLIVIEVTDRIFVKGELGTSSRRESLADKVAKLRASRDSDEAQR